MSRPTREELEQALRVAAGSIAEAARLLTASGKPITRGHATVLVRRLGLVSLGQELRAGEEAKKPPMPPKEQRCKWGGCRSPKVNKVFCQEHTDRHNAQVADKVADRKARHVCIICGGSLDKDSSLHCTKHLSKVRDARANRRAAGKRG